ncbi:Hpt domain-containing protein [Pseudoalteromonas sp. MMG013]|uniref:HPt domain-containing protein n=1 Tax=Pseudoalteromonas aurantia 208 TaxID=1314867 RepID=A0ABR9EBN4_9GAMM|nr:MULTISPECIES: Hpt domain-containing protein [Pseudoalteromonas]MBE0368242.1 hypothetical protein [Pseudoalteromonas aurantia 208]MBQ4846092.1 Hpt domain-containing protein [Pseudoalteromonas sp. MMG005]MBQ4851582.1 Hpt domain-containing protein [Pseudoalteromonas sp. MMG012]MBQ4863528.1 Hpt domain-containing protein [Pseudoalteromonas sp. MMG013]
MIDLTTYSQLQVDVGEELAAQLLGVYLSESQVLIKRLTTSNDCDLLQITAHSLKSSSRSYGALQLAELCEKIEHQIKTVGVCDEVTALIAAAHQQSTVTFTDAYKLINGTC